jgi:hypothetical protein
VQIFTNRAPPRGVHRSEALPVAETGAVTALHSLNLSVQNIWLISPGQQLDPNFHHFGLVAAFSELVARPDVQATGFSLRSLDCLGARVDLLKFKRPESRTSLAIFRFGAFIDGASGFISFSWCIAASWGH